MSETDNGVEQGIVSFEGALDDELFDEDGFVEDEEGGTFRKIHSKKDGGFRRSTFVDYIPPPTKPNPPPAKYKYTAVIALHVYVCASFIQEAGIKEALTRSGLMNETFAFFWMFFLEIFVIIYFTQGPLNYIAKIKIRGEEYGIDAWMKKPRHTWLKKYDNVFAEFLYLLVHIAEDGFKMFNPPPRAVKKKEDPADDTTMDTEEDDDEVALHVNHRIRPDALADYQKWKRKIVKYMRTQPGFVRFEQGEVEGDMHTVCIVFDSHETLHDYMTSPARERIYEKIKSCLIVPSKMKLKTKQPDAVSEMLVPQGESEPTYPPKKWKVCWIVTVALNFGAMIWGAVMPFYYEAWGLDQQSVWIQRLVQFALLVPLIVYVLAPVLMLLLHEWVRRKPDELDTKQPWKGLNDGLPLWMQAIGCLAFFAGTGTSWALRAQEGVAPK